MRGAVWTADSPPTMLTFVSKRATTTQKVVFHEMRKTWLYPVVPGDTRLRDVLHWVKRGHAVEEERPVDAPHPEGTRYFRLIQTANA